MIIVSHGHNHNGVEGVVAGGAEHGCWVRIHFAKVMFVHVHGNFCVFLLLADFPNQKDFLPFEMPEDLHHLFVDCHYHHHRCRRRCLHLAATTIVMVCDVIFSLFSFAIIKFN